MSTELLTKLSVRTLRNPCKYCGTKDLYAAKNTVGKTVVVDASLARSIGVGQTFYGQAHYLTCPSRIKAVHVQLPKDQALYEQNIAIAANAAVASEPEPVIADDPRLSAIQALLAGPTETDIRKWINDALSKQDRPERIIVRNADGGEAVELEGHNHVKQSVVIRVLNRGLIPMLVGDAGTGKSMMAAKAAKALSLHYTLVSCDPSVTSLVDIFGFMGPHGYVESDVYRAVSEGHLVLFDEADKCHPGVFAKCNALFAAKPGDRIKFPCGMVEVHEGFKAMIAANTYATGPDATYVGSNRLDGATLDRFTTIYVEYDESLEVQLCRATGATEANIQAVLAVVRHGRRQAAKQGLRVILGMRSSIIACTLAAGDDPFTVEEITEMAIRRGISSTDWDSLSMPPLVLA